MIRALSIGLPHREVPDDRARRNHDPRHARRKLQKVLARLGIASRRDVEKWIVEGRVKVNGAVATLGQRVDSHDAIAVDGRLLKREETSRWCGVC